MTVASVSPEHVLSLTLLAATVLAVPTQGGHPTGVVRVADEPSLARAVRGARSGTTILVAAGRYRLTVTVAIANVDGLEIRGESGNRDDVVIEGPGLQPVAGQVPLDGFWLGRARGVTVADLTVRDFPRHGVIMNAGTEAPRIRNVRFVDAGQQFVKANPDAEGRGIRRGVVEDSRFEYTTTSRDSYTNGISAIGAQGWVVRRSWFVNMRGPGGQLGGPALLFRGGARDTLVERNTFVNCQRGVMFGMVDRTPDDHSGGVIRNNMFHRGAAEGGDVGISLWDAPGARVLHNTVIVSGTYHAAIDYRFADTRGVVIANNLTDAPTWAREGARADEQGNFVKAVSAMFVDAARRNLHLLPTAREVIDRAVALPPDMAVTDDWDGDSRPAGKASDIGADEHRVPVPR